MANDQGNKSLEQLQKEKVQAEINILEARLAKEFPDEKPRGRLGRLADFARKWSAFILGTVTLISAVFGVFVPLAEYLDERRNALKYDLNENMISFVDNMMSTDQDTVNRGVMMLSYYEINSIPILLHFLSKSESSENRQKITENIHWIHFDNSRNNIVEMVLGRVQYNFEKLKSLNDMGDYSIDDPSQLAIQNYIELLKVLKLSGRECRKIKSNFEELLVTMDTDPDEFYENNTNAKGVKVKISGFLENSKYCN